jgi:hypothetical protein
MPMATREVVLAASAWLVVAPAWGAPPYDGRWAAEAAACAVAGDATSPLVVTSFALRWREAACTIRTSYLVKDAWHIGARCRAGGATSNVPIRLQVRGERLVLDWAGAPVEELRRCP